MNVTQDHWIGLTYWNNVTLSKPQQLLIEMEDWEGNRCTLEEVKKIQICCVYIHSAEGNRTVIDTLESNDFSA